MNSSESYAQEMEIACLAVQRSAVVTKALLASVDIYAQDKMDDTPVTIADFASQALIISALHKLFPNDSFLGEESATMLRKDSALLASVWTLVSESTKLEDACLSSPATKEEMLDIIDLGGKGTGGREGRVWVLDPVDGTVAFIRNQQYAVSLALLENGQQKLGVLGCPNLNLETGRVIEDVVDRNGYGQIISVIAGQGAFIRPIQSGCGSDGSRLALARPIKQHRSYKLGDSHNFRFVDCEASLSTDTVKHAKVASRLSAVLSWQTDRTDLWSSQMRYVALAVGGCNTMIKIPMQEDTRSSTWDHAGGVLLAEEVGLTVTDLHGCPVDFGLGRKLANSYGLVIAPRSVHVRVLDAVRAVMAEGNAR